VIRRAAGLVLVATACGGSAAPSNSAAAPAEEPPVALNAEPAVQYPPDLYDQRVGGDVVLRLFADSTGRLVPESTRVAQSSGFAASTPPQEESLGCVTLARRHPSPVSTTFLQTMARHPVAAFTDGAGQPP
jgi:hypothetical protein